MGLVFNNNNNNIRNNWSDQKYISYPQCRESVSRQRQVKVLTHQNIQFLRNLGLKVVPGGRSRV